MYAYAQQSADFRIEWRKQSGSKQAPLVANTISAQNHAQVQQQQQQQLLALPSDK